MLLRLALALILLALAVAIVTALLIPFTDCAEGFTIHTDVIPYCGSKLIPPA